MRKISQYYTYKINDKEYKIRFRTPNIGEQISIGNAYTAYKSGFQNLDDISDMLAYAIATLNVVIVEKPTDLNLEEIDADDWKTVRQMFEDYKSFAFFRNETPKDNTQ
jgi:hypothetical protein